MCVLIKLCLGLDRSKEREKLQETVRKFELDLKQVSNIHIHVHVHI